MPLVKAHLLPRLPSKFPYQSHRRCLGRRKHCFHDDSWAVSYHLTLTPCEAVLLDTISQTRVLTLRWGDLSKVTDVGSTVTVRQADTIPRLSGLERQQRAGVQQELVKAILPSVLVPALAAWICDVSCFSVSLPRPRGRPSCPKSPQSHAAASPMDFSKGGAVQWLKEQTSGCFSFSEGRP